MGSQRAPQARIHDRTRRLPVWFRLVKKDGVRITASVCRNAHPKTRPIIHATRTRDGRIEAMSRDFFAARSRTRGATNDSTMGQGNESPAEVNRKIAARG